MSIQNELENKIKDLQAELSKINSNKNASGGALCDAAGGSYKLPKATVALRRRCAI